MTFALRRVCFTSSDVHAILLPLTVAAASAAQEDTPEQLIEAGHWKRTRALAVYELKLLNLFRQPGHEGVQG